jgi:hypothetical protein
LLYNCHSIINRFIYQIQKLANLPFKYKILSYIGKISNFLSNYKNEILLISIPILFNMQKTYYTFRLQYIYILKSWSFLISKGEVD